jgi:2,3-bisphosphoglycerate-dependent phosphoglycerate mutase
MRFTLIRHAQPEWVRHGLNIDDPPLTDLGRAQAEHLGERFRGESADVLLVSTLRRAQETAEPVAGALGLKAEPCDWLAEIASPEWEGTPAAYVEQVFREHRGKPVEDLWAGIEGGESFHGFHRRVTHGLQEFLDGTVNERVHDDPAMWQLTEPERRVIIVAHAGTNAAAIGYLLGIPPVPWEWERFVSFHASVSTVDPIEISGRHAFSLVRFADVAHLPPGLQTR